MYPTHIKEPNIYFHGKFITIIMQVRLNPPIHFIYTPFKHANTKYNKSIDIYTWQATRKTRFLLNTTHCLHNSKPYIFIFIRFFLENKNVVLFYNFLLD